MNETLNQERKRFTCDRCEYSCNNSGNFKRHIKQVHDKIKDFVCDRDDCKMAFSTKCDLQRHIKQVHDKIKDFVCDRDDCKMAFSTNRDLKRHIKQVHDKIKDFVCNIDGCEKSFTTNGNLKDHLANIHDIDIVWYHCPKEKCKYKCKSKNSLKKHLSNIHDIDVIWYYCPENNCDFKCKHKPNLKIHQKTCMGNDGVGSNGEKYVKQCLSDLGFLLDEDYVFNQSFQPLSQYANKALKPDFRFLHHNIIIEYDGEQHFRPATFGGISKEQAEENFRKTQERDKLKDDFCKENNFKMIRIPYTEFENTLSILTTELFDIVDWFG